jgi:hypothetical protein
MDGQTDNRGGGEKQGRASEKITRYPLCKPHKYLT